MFRIDKDVTVKLMQALNFRPNIPQMFRSNLGRGYRLYWQRHFVFSLFLQAVFRTEHYKGPRPFSPTSFPTPHWLITLQPDTKNFSISNDGVAKYVNTNSTGPDSADDKKEQLW